MTTRKAKARKGAKAKDSATTDSSTVAAEEVVLSDSDPKRKPFVPENLDRTVIAIPLLKILEKERDELKAHSEQPPKAHPVIIDLNLEYPQGRDIAREWVIETAENLIEKNGANKDSAHQGINKSKSGLSQQYIFAKLEGEVIRALVSQDTNRPRGAGGARAARAIYHIWPDFKIRALINKTLSTVKADAAHASFSAFGEGIVWAVMDSGIDKTHSHFKMHGNLELEAPLTHMDFTSAGGAAGAPAAPSDPNGHGTHVAGIIAGELRASEATGNGKAKSRTAKSQKIKTLVRSRDEHGEIIYDTQTLDAISGMASKCKLVSLRVLDENGEGDVSSLIAAIEKIQEINGYGRRLLIHGVNISVGNEFEPEWFACGQSPLCVEVNRLVASGVVVVAAAGNSGYGTLQSEYTGIISAGLSLTVNDPGNAEGAITVGSTHRFMPHIYGVSYFSSKGPTGDGRAKPDLVAPGEKIISCAAGKARQRAAAAADDCDYIEDSGTSMAAPHVSGVIAAFLSVRPEFIGQPERVKEIFLSTATDLKREKYFQGYGLVDLMRAIQSV
jgi:serine protease AprX